MNMPPLRLERGRARDDVVHKGAKAGRSRCRSSVPVVRNDLNAFEKAQFLRYRYEQGKPTQNYLEKWETDDELRKLCEGLADATGDVTYRRMHGAESPLNEF